MSTPPTAPLPVWMDLLPDVRALAESRIDNDYFRGLVSGKLGSEHRLDDDDELLDLILENSLLDAIYDDLFNTPLGKARIASAVSNAFSAPGLGGPGLGDLCLLVWGLVVADPRFDVVLKQAIESSKAAPQTVRGSGTSKVAGVLEKIRSALASGAARHSNAVLAGSVMAGLLAGGAAVKVIPIAISGNTSDREHVDISKVVTAIGDLTAEVKQQTNVSSSTNINLQKLAEQNSQLSGLNDRLKALEDAAKDSETGKLEVKIETLTEQIRALKENPGTSPAMNQRIDTIDKSIHEIQNEVKNLEASNQLATILRDGPNSISAQLNNIAQALRETPTTGATVTLPGNGQNAKANTTDPNQTVVSQLVQLNSLLKSLNLVTPHSFSLVEVARPLLAVRASSIVRLPRGHASCALEITLYEVSGSSAKIGGQDPDSDDPPYPSCHVKLDPIWLMTSVPVLLDQYLSADGRTSFLTYIQVQSVHPARFQSIYRTFGEQPMVQLTIYSQEIPMQ
jgi:hypothetical protein